MATSYTQDPDESKLKATKTKSGKVWWVNGAFIIFVHLVSILTLLGLPWHSVAYQTKILTFITWELATLGITMGYHRLWSHGAYKAHWLLRVCLAFMGTLGFQGSIRWWVVRHRLHHRFTDSSNDPYDAKKGFWFSHMGWVFQKAYYPKMSLIDMSDLDRDPIVMFQHRYYVWLALLSGFILPTLIGHFGWNDGLGALLYSGYVSRVAIWHVTFCINSFAHWLGEQEFSTENTSRGGLILALFTQGEGNHNFHHENPSDYRNGVHWYDWDPTKWIIFCFSLFGLARDLKRVPWSMIESSRKLNLLKKSLNTGSANQDELDYYREKNSAFSSKLPKLSRKQFLQQVQEHGREWTLIDGYACDIGSENFMKNHPGGDKVLRKYIGRDATSAFFGGLNWHTQSARMWMRQRRVAAIVVNESSSLKIGTFDSRDLL